MTAVPLTPVMTWATLSTCEAGDPGAMPKTRAPALLGVTVYPRWVSAAAVALDWAWLISKKPCVANWSAGVGPSSAAVGTPGCQTTRSAATDR